MLKIHPALAADATTRPVLVTGAAGLVGVPLVRALRRGGHTVVAVDDGSAGTLGRLAEFLPDDGVHVVIADVRDGISLTSLMREARPWAVAHLAAKHFIPECEAAPGAALDVNVLGTQRILDACAVAPPKRFLFASTADVYATDDAPHAETSLVAPRGVYGTSKLTGEHLLRDQAHRLGISGVVVARLFNVYGPGDPHPHLIPEILRQVTAGETRLSLGDLSSARDYVFVDDVADMLSSFLASTVTGIFNVGTGVATTGYHLVRLIGDVVGRNLVTEVDPARVRQVERKTLCAAPDRLVSAVGHPATSLRDGLAATLAATTVVPTPAGVTG
ncbi:NAD-dependent epimerase/dehydratase family protein [Myceligenerans xiligouense]|uniref:UDP-glucose 4-epimerase n=1 Tax=Myceligenerans xiligouense TaxID=253184 RepID=A0A3N4YJS8_9MICO|nr:NAD-dependent epimerase/dehydratase family protein [Myceligenerans xiligouense]RPF20357.1 UDP-glucose 4-epimerase [Myceligenerans xiligouense]